MPWPWSRPDGPAFSATRHPPKNCRGCCRRGPKKTRIKDREETGHEPLGPRRHALGKTARLGRTCMRAPALWLLLWLLVLPPRRARAHRASTVSPAQSVSGTKP